MFVNEREAFKTCKPAVMSVTGGVWWMESSWSAQTAGNEFLCDEGPGSFSKPTRFANCNGGMVGYSPLKKNRGF